MKLLLNFIFACWPLQVQCGKGIILSFYIYIRTAMHESSEHVLTCQHPIERVKIREINNSTNLKTNIQSVYTITGLFLLIKEHYKHKE